jgi:predicted metal-dependent phosphoesterase TrpH
MVVADLHVHTTASDGEFALSDLPAAAARAGVAVRARTDHDRPHPDLDAPVVERDGVTVVHGIELRVALGDQRVDLLGFGLAPTGAFRELCDRLQRDRMARGRAMIDRLDDRLDATLPVEAEPGIGRPSLARAVAAVTGYDIQGVFDDLIGDGRPCYVPRDVPSFDRGRRLLAESAALVGLAHPLRYDDPGAALAQCDVLDAVELYYPYARSVDREPIERVIAREDLVTTGGSDAHDDRLGRVGLDRADAERFRCALERSGV